MAYPAGVITRTCTVGGASAQESGEPLILSVVVASSRGLIWASTGWRLPSSPVAKTSTIGSEVSFDLPVSDQSGYRDEATGAVIDVSAPDSHTHTYTATITTTRGSKLVNQRVVNFPLPTGDLSPVDVDTLVDAGTVDGVLVSVPDSWSAQVAAAQAAAESAVGQIPTAVADYLTANPPSGSPDATTLAKGIVRLAGDLGGTADAPTVPGLAGKAASIHTHDDRYYTETETAALLAGKQAAGSYAAASHNHDGAYSPIGHNHTGTYAPALGPDDNYVTDAEKAALHTHPAVIAQGATTAAARTAIGAGTSNLVIGTTAGTAKAGDYSPDLSGLVPTSRTVAGKALTGNITLAAGDLTDFTEASQDVVGAMVAAAGGAYDDAGGSITLPAGGSSAQVDIYYAVGAAGSQSVYTWTKPAGAASVNVVVVGAGSGGGSGRRGASGVVNRGGGGGGGGGVSRAVIPAAAIPATVEVLVGKGGAGGAARTADNTDGARGGDGGTSSFGLYRAAESFGGESGRSGDGGNGGNGGYGNAAGHNHGGSAGDSEGGNASNQGSKSAAAPTGGGAGGSVAAGGTPYRGGESGQQWYYARGGVPGGSVGAGGGDGDAASIALEARGGGGGGASSTGPGGNGGTGGIYGGGGGGGGASLNGFPSGAGGHGGDGIVIITTHF